LTGGAASDIGRATEIARAMVVKMGMSDLGPVNYGPRVDIGDMGLNWYEPEQLSEDIRAKVDREVSKIIDNCQKKAEEILLKNRKKLDLVAEELLKKETLEAEDFKEIMERK
jgi:cell division protease FtsH